MKLVATSLVVLASLCVPALADPPAVPIKVKLTVKTQTDKRAYDLLLVDHTCGKSEEKAPDHSDMVKVCAREAEQNNLRLEVEWATRQGNGEYNGATSIVVARGGTAMISSTNAFRLDVAVQ